MNPALSFDGAMYGVAWLVLSLVTIAALSIIWSAVTTGIAPMPSSERACEAMIEAAAGAPAGRVVDLGSGWGTLAIRFARAFPHRQVVGYELSPVPWLAASVAARCLRLRNLSFRRRDFRCADLDDTSVLLCYLFRDGMLQLSERFERGPRRSMVVISNTFALPWHTAAKVVRLKDFHRTPIYLYRLGS